MAERCDVPSTIPGHAPITILLNRCEYDSDMESEQESPLIKPPLNPSFLQPGSANLDPSLLNKLTEFSQKLVLHTEADDNDTTPGGAIASSAKLKHRLPLGGLRAFDEVFERFRSRYKAIRLGYYWSHNLVRIFLNAPSVQYDFVPWCLFFEWYAKLAAIRTQRAQRNDFPRATLELMRMIRPGSRNVLTEIANPRTRFNVEPDQQFLVTYSHGVPDDIQMVTTCIMEHVGSKWRSQLSKKTEDVVKAKDDISLAVITDTGSSDTGGWIKLFGRCTLADGSVTEPMDLLPRTNYMEPDAGERQIHFFLSDLCPPGSIMPHTFRRPLPTDVLRDTHKPVYTTTLSELRGWHEACRGMLVGPCPP